MNDDKLIEKCLLGYDDSYKIYMKVFETVRARERKKEQTAPSRPSEADNLATEAVNKAQLKKALPIIRAEAIKEGRRQVIEEVEELWELVTVENCRPYFRVDYGKWQALKKEVEGK